MFRRFGDEKHCRKIFQRALNSVTDYPEKVVEALLNFERLEGKFIPDVFNFSEIKRTLCL